MPNDALTHESQKKIVSQLCSRSRWQKVVINILPGSLSGLLNIDFPVTLSLFLSMLTGSTFLGPYPTLSSSWLALLSEMFCLYILIDLNRLLRELWGHVMFTTRGRGLTIHVFTALPQLRARPKFHDPALLNPPFPNQILVPPPKKSPPWTTHVKIDNTYSLPRLETVEYIKGLLLLGEFFACWKKCEKCEDTTICHPITYEIIMPWIQCAFTK